MQNCKTTKRLLFAQKKGLINIVGSKICALGFHDINCFKTLKITKLTICHPEKYVVKEAVNLKYFTFVDLDGFKKKLINVLIKHLLTLQKVEKRHFLI